MSEQKEGGNTADPIYSSSRTSAEDDEEQDVRDVLSKHATCVYMPSMPQFHENRSSGSALPTVKAASQFNVFHQLGARPFSQTAATLAQTIDLDDTTRLSEDINQNDPDEIVVLDQNTPVASPRISHRDSDEVVIIGEKPSHVLTKVSVTKTSFDGDHKATAVNVCVTSEYSNIVSRDPTENLPEIVADNTDQKKAAENSMSEASIARVASEYGDMSMDLDSEMNNSTSSGSCFDDVITGHMTPSASKESLSQAFVFKGCRKTCQSPPPKEQSSRQLHTSAGSLSAGGDEEVTFLMERKASKSSPKGKKSRMMEDAASMSAPIAKRAEKNGEVRDLISAAYIPRGLVRAWQSCRPPKSPPLPTKNAVPLTVCSYNVLCQTTIADTSYLYTHLSDKQHLLDWSYRSALLREELPMLDADILCLQEVQNDHYDDFYVPLMSQLGYEGCFKKRTGEKVDGCATFWRTSKFQMQDYRWIEYNVAPNSTLDRDNVGIIVALTVKGTQARLFVANTHLLFNPNRGDVKLAQLAMLFSNLEQMSYRGEENDRDSLVICGDFNMEPLSPNYEFIVVGDLRYVGLPQNELSGQGRTGGRLMPPAFIPPSANVTAHCLLPDEHNRRHPTPPPYPTTGFLRHQLNLMSVYRHKTDRDTFELSTYHSKESAMPDFIFYSLAKKSVAREEEKLVCRGVMEGRLKCVRRLALPDVRFMEDTVGRLPNAFCPSDHIPLLAEFVFDTS
uniref:Endonuclease/exonuclease/phosphatase domain-containing protein n=1 Tax=Plectus sambesii TaxID=2011161 RepID=A0A914WA32_9BILA